MEGLIFGILRYIGVFSLIDVPFKNNRCHLSRGYFAALAIFLGSSSAISFSQKYEIFSHVFKLCEKQLSYRSFSRRYLKN